MMSSWAATRVVLRMRATCAFASSVKRPTRPFGTSKCRLRIFLCYRGVCLILLFSNCRRQISELIYAKYTAEGVRFLEYEKDEWVEASKTKVIIKIAYDLRECERRMDTASAEEVHAVFKEFASPRGIPRASYEPSKKMHKPSLQRNHSNTSDTSPKLPDVHSVLPHLLPQSVPISQAVVPKPAAASREQRSSIQEPTLVDRFAAPNQPFEKKITPEDSKVSPPEAIQSEERQPSASIASIVVPALPTQASLQSMLPHGLSLGLPHLLGTPNLLTSTLLSPIFPGLAPAPEVFVLNGPIIGNYAIAMNARGERKLVDLRRLETVPLPF